jgi:hypothetical protein
MMSSMVKMTTMRVGWAILLWSMTARCR